MSGFLREMAESAAERAAVAQRRHPERELKLRIADLPPPRPLSLTPSRFELIAEIKRRWPSGRADGRESAPDPVVLTDVVTRAKSYAAGGAAAISVLSEPTRFGGSLTHLEAVASEVRLPVLRKDFLVDPYQLYESRAAGASGALLIVRMLPGDRLHAMVAAALEAELFVLLESFDETDLERACEIRARWPRQERRLLLGVNARDLTSFEVDRSRFERLAPLLPAGAAGVAESGIDGPDDAGRVSAYGYGAALVGRAVMRAQDPAAAAASLIAAGRGALR